MHNSQTVSVSVKGNSLDLIDPLVLTLKYFISSCPYYRCNHIPLPILSGKTLNRGFTIDEILEAGLVKPLSGSTR